jgi:hypothetical protein
MRQRHLAVAAPQSTSETLLQIFSSATRTHPTTPQPVECRGHRPRSYSVALEADDSERSAHAEAGQVSEKRAYEV